MQLIELAAQYRATGNALRARAATLRLELAAMPRAGRRAGPVCVPAAGVVYLSA